MPTHLSHLLQLLNVGYFALLKKAYRKQIEDLIRSRINYITKLEFLLVFKAAFKAAFTKEYIVSIFRGARLVLLDLEAVLSKLDIKIRILTPTLPEVAS